MRVGYRAAYSPITKQLPKKASIETQNHFLSLYRLFLRTAAASVLHHKQATRNLRALYKSTFADAAAVIKSAPERDMDTTEEWLRQWDRRVDGTLAFLHASAESRGLPHKLTTNLAFFVLGHHQRLLTKRPVIWNPSLPLDSPAYQPGAQKQKAPAKSDVADGEFNPLAEVLKMAEARQSLILGQMPSGHRRFSKTLLDKISR